MSFWEFRWMMEAKLTKVEEEEVVEVDMEIEEGEDREEIIMMLKEAKDQEMRRRDIQRRILNSLNRTSHLLTDHLDFRLKINSILGLTTNQFFSNSMVFVFYILSHSIAFSIHYYFSY